MICFYTNSLLKIENQIFMTVCWVLYRLQALRKTLSIALKNLQGDSPHSKMRKLKFRVVHHPKLTTELGFKPRLTCPAQLFPLLLINKHSYRCCKPWLGKEDANTGPYDGAKHITRITECLVRWLTTEPTFSCFLKEPSEFLLAMSFPKAGTLFRLGFSKPALPWAGRAHSAGTCIKWWGDVKKKKKVRWC